MERRGQGPAAESLREGILKPKHTHTTVLRFYRLAFQASTAKPGHP